MIKKTPVEIKTTDVENTSTLDDLDPKTKKALAADVHRALDKLLRAAKGRSVPYPPDEVVQIIEAFRNVVLSLIAKGH